MSPSPMSRLLRYVSHRKYLLGGVVCLLASGVLTANAMLTVSSTGLLGDSSVSVDASGNLNLGTASSTAVVIAGSSTPTTILGNLSVNGTLTLGTASTTGQLLFKNASSSFITTLRASSSQGSSLTFTLPPTAGTAGQAMLTDGNGNLYFGDAAASSSPWASTSTGISYSGGNVAISGTVLRGGGDSLPATCTVGDQYFLATGTTGNYQCTATNTWTLPGGGVSAVSVSCPSSACTVGITAGAYTSGWSASGGSGAGTCPIAPASGGGSGAVGTVPISDNTIAASVVLTWTTAGSGYTSLPTTAMVTGACSNGATVTGTATVTTTGVSVSVTQSGYYQSGVSANYTVPTITAVPTWYYFQNSPNTSGVITVQLPSATTITVWGTAGAAAGTFHSTGLLGDAALVTALATGQYMGTPYSGLWINP